MDQASATIRPIEKAPWIWRWYPAVYDLGTRHLVPYRRLRADIQTAAHRSVSTESPHLLDCCCGTGNMLEALQREIPNAVATAIDFSPEMIQRAQSRCDPLGHVNWVRAKLLDGLKTLPDAGVDVAVMSNGFYPLPDPTAVLAQLKRVLKPDGAFILSDPKAGSKLRHLLIHHLVKGHLLRLYALPLFIGAGLFSWCIGRDQAYAFHSTQQAADMLRRAGFAITEQGESYGGANYFFVARREA
jgi:ubiquinone/menaquinone biosynthesis C-methylase UbiE